MTMLAQNLKIFREKNKLKQREVAELINSTQRTYSGYETGTNEPDIKTLIKLAELFKVPLDILVGRYVDVSLQPPPAEPRKRGSANKSSVQLVVSANDSIINNGSGDMYVKLTPGQMRKIKELS